MSRSNSLEKKSQRSVLSTIAIVIATLLTLSMWQVTPSHAASSDTPEEEAKWQNESDINGRQLELEWDINDLPEGEFTTQENVVSPMSESRVYNAGNCAYTHGSDYAHVTDANTAASAHGWWVKKSANGCPDKAKVRVHLQAWYCQTGNSACSWVTVKSGPSTSIKQGTSKRANARSTCASTATKVAWRGMVDVDLPWIVDPSELFSAGARNINCSPK